jgi:hypothetical protein
MANPLRLYNTLFAKNRNSELRHADMSLNANAQPSLPNDKQTAPWNLCQMANQWPQTHLQWCEACHKQSTVRRVFRKRRRAIQRAASRKEANHKLDEEAYAAAMCVKQ